MRLFVDGISGFVGSWFAEYALEQGAEVFGLCRWRSNKENLKNILGKITLVNGDLMDQGGLVRILADVQPDYIMHFAAASHVPTSFGNPIATLQTNIIGTCNLLEAGRIAGIDARWVIVSCYDEETKAITRNGEMSFHKLNIGDLVLSFNKENRTVEWKPITKVIISDYSGQMCHVNTRSIDMLLTPNHSIVCLDSGKNNIIERSASDFNRTKTPYYLPAGRFSGKNNDTISIGCKEYLTNDIFYLAGLYIGDGSCDESNRYFPNKTGLKRKEYLVKCRDGKGKFCSGRRGDIDTVECKCYRVFLHIPVDKHCRKNAEAVLGRLGIKYSCYKNSLYFSSEILMKFLSEFGHSAITKTIPDWMFDYDAEKLDYLYNGMIDTDGSVRKGYINQLHVYTTSSHELSQKFSVLCMMTGRHVTIGRRSPRNNAFIRGRKINTKYDNYVCCVSKRNRGFSGNYIEPENYSGKVWCVEVEDNHNLAVVRNGRYAFCGNSSEVYGQPLPHEVPITEKNPLRPASPYGVSKVGADMIGLQYHLSYGMPIVRTRLFTHSGARRGEVFFESSFAKQIAAAELGLQEPVIRVGNLESVRTLLDVKDAVRAYWLVKDCTPDVYNIGGTEVFTVGEVLDKLLSMVPNKYEVVEDPKLLRPSDITLQLPDTGRFRHATGWKPEIPIETTLRDLLNFWIDELKEHPWKAKI